jgi:hypothetical protein
MEETWKPTTVGILCVISGATDILLGVLTVFAGNVVIRSADLIGEEWVMDLVMTVVMVVGPIWILLGVVALLGGIFALRRCFWGLALAGSICALSGVTVLGMLAIVFVAMGRNEFE